MPDYPAALPPADMEAAGRNHGQEWDEVYAALTELGTDPSGTAYATVKARLAAVEATASPTLLLPSARASATGVRMDTSLFPFRPSSQATLAIGLGNQYLAVAPFTGGTIEEVSIITSASSLTAGQSIELSLYADNADGGPGLRLWTTSIVVGTTVGEVRTTGLSLALPYGWAWVSFLNPSGNAGTVTMRTLDPMCRHVQMQNNGQSGAYAVQGGVASAPADMSAQIFRSTTASNEIAGHAGTMPQIGVQAA